MHATPTILSGLSRLGWALQFLSLLVIHWLQTWRAQGENHYDYRYGFYGEEDGRVEVNTHTAYFEQKLAESVAAHGEFVYDSISGATPNGLVPSLTPNWLSHLTEIRRAGNLGLDLQLGRHTLAPLAAYSTESDYESKGVSLSDAIEFNQKNTTLRLGVSRNFDRVLGVDPNNPNSDRPRFWTDKDATEGLIGLSQLLDPKTILTADFTYGYETGYLNDPYRGVFFQGWLGIDNSVAMPEVRPDHRSKEVFLVTLTHYFDPLNASVEGSYRFYHDSYDIFAHTVAVAWHQRLGQHLIIEPLIRFYEQSDASFYTPLGVPGYFPGDGISRPAHYSADYRLSHFLSVTYGLQASLILKEHIFVDVGYHRYEMHGQDNATSPLLYPKANIYTVGLRLWF